LIHTGVFNLGLLMRTLLGVGTPRSLQACATALLAFIWCLLRLPETVSNEIWATDCPSRLLCELLAHRNGRPLISADEGPRYGSYNTRTRPSG
jgi:hypothetical protein